MQILAAAGDAHEVSSIVRFVDLASDASSSVVGGDVVTLCGKGAIIIRFGATGAVYKTDIIVSSIDRTSAFVKNADRPIGGVDCGLDVVDGVVIDVMCG